MDVRVFVADTPTVFDQVAALWRRYGEEHADDLGRQDLAAEGAALPAGYEHPDGAVLVAKGKDRILGTVAVKRFDGEVCEMKRLYVPPEGRGHGVGRRLAQAVLRQARSMGFTSMVLDTTESMQAARALYRSLEFEESEAFGHSPCNAPVYMVRTL